MPSDPPLAGIRVLEFAGLAPGPFAGLLLADSGASVIRIDRVTPNANIEGKSDQPAVTADHLTRRKTSISVDLKNNNGVAFIKKLIGHADVLIDPFRPGVLERVGLGPNDLLQINNRLIYARITGFRRDGKYKDMAGHDINYLAVSGTLSMLGRAGEKPYAPANILGDFAGGGANLFQGILLALLARQRTGRGQIVEANMVDGSAYLTTFPRQALKTPTWSRPRGQNLLDGGSPYYDTYETKDSKHVAVGALEPQFFEALLRGLELNNLGLQQTRLDPDTWPSLRELFTETFKTRTRLEWEKIFDGTDACVTPVLDYTELETEHGREGDQRPVVTLRDTPSLAITDTSDANSEDSSRGQGKGVPGGGYVGQPIAPGQGGVETVFQWTGWRQGKDFEIRGGGLVLDSFDSPKL